MYNKRCSLTEISPLVLYLLNNFCRASPIQASPAKGSASGLRQGASPLDPWHLSRKVHESFIPLR